MQRWQERVAVVTGASAGIGAAICRDLVAHGVTVVGLARREEKLKELSSELKGKTGKFHYRKTDVTKEDEVIAAFDMIEKELGGVDILVNNAGSGIPTLVKHGEIDKWETMFRLNVFAVGMCMREALKSMKARGVDDGHIVNINSIAGHRLPQLLQAGVYSAAKNAVRILTEALRRELVADKSKIKVTSLSPGVTRTEYFKAGGWVGRNYDNGICQEPEEIAVAVRFVLDTPPGTQVNELITRAVGEGM